MNFSQFIQKKYCYLLIANLCIAFAGAISISSINADGYGIISPDKPDMNLIMSLTSKTEAMVALTGSGTPIFSRIIASSLSSKRHNPISVHIPALEINRNVNNQATGKEINKDAERNVTRMQDSNQKEKEEPVSVSAGLAEKK